MATLFKIMRAGEWAAFQRDAVFHGSDADHRDGYVHLSYHDQVHDTAVRHFSGLAGLMLVAIDGERCRPWLKEEVSRNGALFPHLYRALALDDVKWTAPITLDPSGLPVLPPLPPDAVEAGA